MLEMIDSDSFVCCIRGFAGPTFSSDGAPDENATTIKVEVVAVDRLYLRRGAGAVSGVLNQ